MEHSGGQEADAGADAAAASGPAGQVDADEFLRLSDGLRSAFADVQGAKLTPEDGARWQRRLIAVTNVAKRDLAGALDMLARFERDWLARRK